MVGICSFSANNVIFPFNWLIIGGSWSERYYLLKCLYEKYLIGRYDLIILYSDDVGDQNMLGEEKQYCYFSDTAIRKSRFLAGDIDEIEKRQTHIVKRGEEPFRILCIFNNFCEEKSEYGDVFDMLMVKYNLLNISVVTIIGDAQMLRLRRRENITMIFVFKMQGVLYDVVLNHLVLNSFDSRDLVGTMFSNVINLAVFIMELIHQESCRCMIIDFLRMQGPLNKKIYYFKV
jgi:hypothetical protein